MTTNWPGGDAAGGELRNELLEQVVGGDAQRRVLVAVLVTRVQEGQAAVLAGADHFVVVAEQLYVLRLNERQVFHPLLGEDLAERDEVRRKASRLHSAGVRDLVVGDVRIIPAAAAKDLFPFDDH